MLYSQQRPGLKQLKRSEKKYGRNLERVFGISAAQFEEERIEERKHFNENTITSLRNFCAYASEDRPFFHRLEQALGMYRHQGLISLWHQGELLPGSEWDSEIRHQMHAADIILLLISPAFLHSDYSWNKEIQWAMTRHVFNTIGGALRQIW